MKSPSSVRLPVVNTPDRSEGCTPRGRRGFLRALAGGGAAAAALAVAPKVAKADARPSGPPRLKLTNASSLAAGEIFDFSYPSDHNTAFLTRLTQPALGGVGEGQDIVAFLRACPHMGCEIVELQIDKAVLGPCGCHRSRFDLSQAGRQIIGRASQNLVQVTLDIESGVIVATGLIGLPYGEALGGNS